MANSKVSALTAKATPVTADTIYLVDSADGTSKKCTLLQMFAAASPTLVTPVLGAATATSINGLTITSSAAGVLTIVAAKTLTVNKSITLEGTDATTMTFPTTSATIARTDAANTFTGASTASAWVLTSPTVTTKISPTTDDGAPLGDTTHNFSDVFLATGAVLNYQNGNVVLTHSSGILTLGTGDLRITTAGTNAASVVTVGGTQTLTAKTLTAPSISDAVQTGITRKTIAVPTAKTVSATLTGAEVIVGMITVNQGGGASSALQLPTGTDLEAAITPALVTGDAFDVSVMNLSTVDAEDASITTNTNMTLVGSMDFQAHSALASGSSSGILRFRKTALNTFTVYRIA